MLGRYDDVGGDLVSIRFAEVARVAGVEFVEVTADVFCASEELHADWARNLLIVVNYVDVDLKTLLLSELFIAARATEDEIREREHERK